MDKLQKKICSVVFAFVLFFNTNDALAEIVDVQVFAVTNSTDLEIVSNTTMPHDSGLSVVNGGNAVVWAPGRPITDAQKVVRNESNIRYGDYMVMCFRPTKSMYVRLIDIPPNDEAGQIFPDGPGALFVQGGRMYCFGDLNSAYFYKMDDKKGGGGRIWIRGGIGAPPPLPINLFLEGKPSNSSSVVFDEVVDYRIRGYQ